MRGVLRWLLAFAALALGMAMRPQSDRNDPLAGVDPADVENPAMPVLHPFEIDLTLQNEEAVLQNSQGRISGTLVYKALPQEASLDDAASSIITDLEKKLKESDLGCKLEKQGTSGSTIKLLMTITSYQLSKVLPKKAAKDFGDSMRALPEALAQLQVQQLLYDDILEKAKNFLEAKWIAKIPTMLSEKLKESGVDATLQVSSKPLPELKTLALTSSDLVLRVELPEGRVPLAKAARVKADEHMKQQDYLKVVQPKIQEEVARAIRDSLGDFSFEAKAECDADFGGHSKHSFWLAIHISNFDEVQTLEKFNKTLAGRAQQFLSLLDVLHKCGVPGLEGPASKMRKLLRDGALKNWHAGLTKKIGELLHAEVQAVSSSSFTWLQGKAASGICCRSERSVSGKMEPDEVFWISADVTAGATKGRHDGFCPTIRDTENPPCVANTSSPEDVTLHHRPYTECFNLAELQDFQQVAEMKAPLVRKPC